MGAMQGSVLSPHYTPCTLTTMRPNSALTSFESLQMTSSQCANSQIMTDGEHEGVRELNDMVPIQKISPSTSAK